MTSISGGFGLPPQVVAKPPDEPVRDDQVTLQVLTVQVRENGYPRHKMLGVAVTAEKLQDFFNIWIGNPANKERYIGSARITPVPFVDRL